MDEAGEDGLSAIGEGISSPFPAAEVAVQNQFAAVTQVYWKTQDYLSSQHPKTIFSQLLWEKYILLCIDSGKLFIARDFFGHATTSTLFLSLMQKY